MTTKPNTEPKDSYLNRCIGCSKVKTSSPDKICASCSNKGFTIPIDTDPLKGEIKEFMLSLGYRVSKPKYGWGGGNFTKYDTKNKVTTTILPQHAAELLALIKDREQKARVEEVKNPLRLFNENRLDGGKGIDFYFVLSNRLDELNATLTKGDK